MTRAEQIVLEARTWLNTNWAHRGSRKGSGVDCAHFVAEIFFAVGAVPRFELPAYSEQYALHKVSRLMVETVERCGLKPVEGPGQDGDVALFKFGRCPSHPGIVDGWPRIIHAYKPTRRVEYSDAVNGPLSTKFAGLWRLP